MKLSLPSTLAFLSLFAAPAFAEKQKIVPPDWVRPANAGPANFSPGILIDGTLYISGQTGSDVKTGEIPDAFEAELKKAFENIGAVLKAAGMGFDNVVTVTVYLTDMDLFQRMNTVYRTYFHDPLPARTTIGVTKLASPRLHAEITVIARK